MIVNGTEIGASKRKPGGRGPSKLTPEVLKEIRAMRRAKIGTERIVKALGISVKTLYRAYEQLGIPRRLQTWRRINRPAEPRMSEQFSLWIAGELIAGERCTNQLAERRVIAAKALINKHPSEFWQGKTPRDFEEILSTAITATPEEYFIGDDDSDAPRLPVGCEIVKLMRSANIRKGYQRGHPFGAPSRTKPAPHVTRVRVALPLKMRVK